MCDFGNCTLTFNEAKFACFIDNETRRPLSVASAASIVASSSSKHFAEAHNVHLFNRVIPILRFV